MRIVPTVPTTGTPAASAPPLVAARLLDREADRQLAEGRRRLAEHLARQAEALREAAR